MKERPILFKAPMVRAILDGTKTQTRRAIKKWSADCVGWFDDGDGEWAQRYIDERGNPHLKAWRDRCPYGKPGDRLWVRETWNVTHHSQLAPGENIAKSAEDCVRDNNGFMPSCAEGVVYAADGVTSHPVHGKARWRSPIHMPRWASRILLEIVSVRVERLQDISEDDARAEGVKAIPDTGGNAGPNLFSIGTDGGWLNSPTAAGAFAMLWELINGEGSWAANPWVWVIEFRRVETTEGA